MDFGMFATRIQRNGHILNIDAIEYLLGIIVSFEWLFVALSIHIIHTITHAVLMMILYSLEIVWITTFCNNIYALMAISILDFLGNARKKLISQ